MTGHPIQQLHVDCRDFREVFFSFQGLEGQRCLCTPVLRLVEEATWVGPLKLAQDVFRTVMHGYKHACPYVAVRHQQENTPASLEAVAVASTSEEETLQPSIASFPALDLEAEFRLQQVPPEKWHVSDLNREYSVCATYPSQVYTPVSIDAKTLTACAQFRSKGRMIALSWYNPAKGNAICRSSQPNVGLQNKHSEADESVIRAVRRLGQHKRLTIVDARSAVAAKGNGLKGHGVENMIHYPKCNL